MSYAAPSKRFARGTPAAEPAQPMNFYAPPKNPEFSNSGVSNAGADAQGTLPAQNQFVAPAPDKKRPGSTPAPGAESYAMPILSGLDNSGTPATTDLASNIVSVGGNTLAGAASGALTGAAIGAAGGPIGAAGGAAIGAGVALVSSGLNAWLGHRQAKAEADRQAALAADAARIRQEEIARDEKWRVQNRLDSLEAAREERKRYNAQQARQRMIDVSTKLQGAMATNASLKQQWAQFGFN